MTKQILIDYDEYIRLERVDILARGQQKTVNELVGKELQRVAETIDKGIERHVDLPRLLQALISVYIPKKHNG